MVCTDVPFPPFGVEDPDSELGYSGFDMELIAAIADTLDRSVLIVPTGFDDFTSGAAMAAGICDLAISAITIASGDDADVVFSDPYFEMPQFLVVGVDSPVTARDDLGPESTVGVHAGVTGEILAGETFAEVEIPMFETYEEMMEALAAGQIDAALQNLADTTEETATGEFKFKFVEAFGTGEFFGIAFAQGSELLQPVNESLATLQADGTYDALFQKYFPVGR